MENCPNLDYSEVKEAVNNTFLHWRPCSLPTVNPFILSTGVANQSSVEKSQFCYPQINRPKDFPIKGRAAWRTGSSSSSYGTVSQGHFRTGSGHPETCLGNMMPAGNNGASNFHVNLGYNEARFTARAVLREGGHEDISIAGRLVGDRGWYLRLNKPSGLVQLGHNSAGAFVTFDSFATGLNYDEEYEFALEFKGVGISGYFNNDLVVSGSSTYNQSETRWGIKTWNDVEGDVPHLRGPHWTMLDVTGVGVDYSATNSPQLPIYTNTNRPSVNTLSSGVHMIWNAEENLPQFAVNGNWVDMSGNIV